MSIKKWSSIKLHIQTNRALRGSRSSMPVAIKRLLWAASMNNFVKSVNNRIISFTSEIVQYTKSIAFFRKTLFILRYFCMKRKKSVAKTGSWIITLFPDLFRIRHRKVNTTKNLVKIANSIKNTTSTAFKPHTFHKFTVNSTETV